MRIIRPVKVTKDGAFTRASTGTYWDKTGAMQTAAANTLRITYDPANLKKAPYALIEPAATNLALNSATGATQDVTTTAGNYTLSMEGAGGVTLSGAATGVLQGDGVSRVKAVFASTGGTVTLTVAGTVTRMQIEAGAVATSYIASGASAGIRAADVVGSTGLVYTNVPENDYPAWSATKVYAQGDRVLDLPNHKVLESVSGQTGTATFTAASAGNVTMKKADGTAYVPAVGNAVVFTGTPPTGVVSGTTYYVQAVTAVAFSVSATAGGAAITTGAQATPMTALASSNLNIAITNVTQWLDAGYDNRWDMFDDSVTSQTSQAGDVVISFYPGTRLDSIAAFNLVANNMKISFVDVVTGESLYCASVNLISNSGIQNLYAYLYEPIVQSTECLVDGIPLGLSANSLITVTFSSNGTTKVGGLLFGLEKDIGITEWGTKVGIIDYSVKTKDAFGNYTITPRAFSKRGDFTVQVPTSQVDSLQSLLATFRATPIVYIGSNSGDKTQFNSTMIYGFYKDFDINIAYNAYSVCSMTVEGLT